MAVSRVVRQCVWFGLAVMRNHERAVLPSTLQLIADNVVSEPCKASRYCSHLIFLIVAWHPHQLLVSLSARTNDMAMTLFSH